jgi:ATP phosphoribosyltransferase regulatory subunit
MDLRQLGRLAPPRQQSRKAGGAVLAPHDDDPALHALVKQLRASGEIVIQALPGHDSSELNCDRRLEKKDGKWHVT